MPRESLTTRRLRLAAIVKEFKRTYPDAHCELNFETPLQLLVATILSAQCTDKQVNIVTGALFKKYRSVDDFANARTEELENDIRRIGLFRSKAKNIRACCKAIRDQHGGQVPSEMQSLVALAGVGRKTANVVLGNAFDKNIGVVVDTHVSRLSQRLRLTRETTPEKIENDLMKIVPQEQWAIMSHWLIWHGRRRCFARNQQCGDCEIGDLCPGKDKG
jgi:endonuclease-3